MSSVLAEFNSRKLARIKKLNSMFRRFSFCKHRSAFSQSTGLIAVCCLGLMGCVSEDSDVEPPIAPLRPVKVLQASAGSAATERTLASTVVSADTQNLSFRIGGSITSLPVNVGDRLIAGALVATLDQQPFQLSEKEARASLAQANANYRNAQSQYQRTRELYATEAASLSDLENSKANESSARANRALAQEGVNAAQLNLYYSQLQSPGDNCQVVSVPVAINQNISAGQTIATTACGDQLRLRTSVPESLINQISIGMPATATLQSGNTLLSGTVIEIGVSNNNGGGYAVEIELDSPSAAVKTGMAAQVTFSLPGNDKRLLVPLIAVLSDSNEKFVFVAEPADDHYRIVRQPVSTGELDNDGIEIVQGLEAGQQVVVAGMSRISEGMKVTLYTGVKP